MKLDTHAFSTCIMPCMSNLPYPPFPLPCPATRIALIGKVSHVSGVVSHLYGKVSLLSLVMPTVPSPACACNATLTSPLPARHYRKKC